MKTAALSIHKTVVAFRSEIHFTLFNLMLAIGKCMNSRTILKKNVKTYTSSRLFANKNHLALCVISVILSPP